MDGGIKDFRIENYVADSSSLHPSEFLEYLIWNLQFKGIVCKSRGTISLNEKHLHLKFMRLYCGIKSKEFYPMILDEESEWKHVL